MAFFLVCGIGDPRGRDKWEESAEGLRYILEKQGVQVFTCPFYKFICLEKRVFSDTGRLDEFFDLTGNKDQQFMNQRTTNQGGDKRINNQVLVGEASVK